MRKILGALLGVALALGLSVGVAGNAFACATPGACEGGAVPPPTSVVPPPPTVTPPPTVVVPPPPTGTVGVPIPVDPHPWPRPVGIPLPVLVGGPSTPCGCGGTQVVVTGVQYTVPATDPWWPGYGVVAGWNTGLNSQACLAATFAVQQEQQFNTVFFAHHGWRASFWAARARAIELANVNLVGLDGGPVVVPTDLVGITHQVWRLQQWLPTLTVGSWQWDHANALLLALQNAQAQCPGVSVSQLNAVYGNWYAALHGVRGLTLSQLLQEQAVACA